MQSNVKKDTLYGFQGYERCLLRMQGLCKAYVKVHQLLHHSTYGSRVLASNMLYMHGLLVIVPLLLLYMHSKSSSLLPCAILQRSDNNLPRKAPFHSFAHLSYMELQFDGTPN